MYYVISVLLSLLKLASLVCLDEVLIVDESESSVSILDDYQLSMKLLACTTAALVFKFALESTNSNDLFGKK